MDRRQFLNHSTALSEPLKAGAQAHTSGKWKRRVMNHAPIQVAHKDRGTRGDECRDGCMPLVVNGTSEQCLPRWMNSIQPPSYLQRRQQRMSWRTTASP